MRQAASESPPSAFAALLLEVPHRGKGCPWLKPPIPLPLTPRSVPFNAGGSEVPPGEKTRLLGNHGRACSVGTNTRESRAKWYAISSWQWMISGPGTHLPPPAPLCPERLASGECGRNSPPPAPAPKAPEPPLVLEKVSRSEMRAPLPRSLMEPRELRRPSGRPLLACRPSVTSETPDAVS